MNFIAEFKVQLIGIIGFSRKKFSSRCNWIWGRFITYSFHCFAGENAIIDLQRERWGIRSSIDLNNPDICFHLHLANYQAILSVDGINSSLHKRGYRPAVGIAPIKETLAAGLMRMTGWDGTKNLVDPLCGSGTFLIEAVSILLGIPSGIDRTISI